MGGGRPPDLPAILASRPGTILFYRKTCGLCISQKSLRAWCHYEPDLATVDWMNHTDIVSSRHDFHHHDYRMWRDVSQSERHSVVRSFLLSLEATGYGSCPAPNFPVILHYSGEDVLGSVRTSAAERLQGITHRHELYECTSEVNHGPGPVQWSAGPGPLVQRHQPAVTAWRAVDGRGMVDGGRWMVDGGRWTVDGGRWTVDEWRAVDGGQWTVDGGRRTVDDGRRTVVSELRTLVTWSAVARSTARRPRPTLSPAGTVVVAPPAADVGTCSGRGAAALGAARPAGTVCRCSVGAGRPRLRAFPPNTVPDGRDGVVNSDGENARWTPTGRWRFSSVPTDYRRCRVIVGDVENQGTGKEYQ